MGCMMEIWKDIPGFEGYYEASSMGNIRRVGAKKALAKTINKDGYVSHVFSVNNKRHNILAHKTIALTFKGPCPKGQVTRHKNGIRTDNVETNLHYGTPADNSTDMVRHGTQAKGVTCTRSKLTEQDVLAIRASNEPHQVIAERFGVTQGNISQIRSRTTWKHI